MRIALFVASASLALIAGCRGPDASQANNSQANISAEASPDQTAAASIVASAATPVNKQDAARIMHERHEGMEAIGKANKAIKRALDGGAPDLAAVRANAGKIAELSRKASSWFPAGTGPDVGKTGAKPEIWQNPQDFGGKLADFQKAAQAFNTAAAGTDVNATKAAFGNLGKACKACHDKYRKEMKH
jgi:cytochrome c556